MTVVPAAHRHPHAEGYGAAWFALLGAPAAWTVYELCAYAITAHACYPMDHLLETSSAGGAWTASLIIIVVTLIIALVSLGTATRVWGQTKMRTDDARPRGDPERSAVFHYMAFMGIPFGVLFSALIVFGLIALFAVPACR
jgi:succinate dehydrogenase hydrophobic anchor subunit